MGSGRRKGKQLHERTGARVALTLTVVVVLLLAGFAVAHVAGFLEPGSLSPSSNAAASTGTSGATPKQTHEPAPKKPAPAVLRPLAEGTGQLADIPTKQEISSAIAEYIDSGSLGSHGGVSVRDVASGKLLFAKNGDDGFTPASTTKVLTAVSALAALGPDHRFETFVVRQKANEIALVGGGDPLLATKKAWARAGQTTRDRRFPIPPTIDDLAAETAKALKAAKLTSVSLKLDDTLFTEQVSSHWRSEYISSGVAARVSSLWVNEARISWPNRGARSSDPAMSAAEAFSSALERNGISVKGDPKRAKAAANTAANTGKLASVRSAPLSEIVEHVLLNSDNDGAEVLARQVAVATGKPATFAGAATAMKAELTKLRIDLSGVKLYDGSGLSRENRIPPDVLTEVLAIAARPENPELRAALTGLPVGGFSGSLLERFTNVGEDGAGRVRAKTGTLSGISSLAGVVTTEKGTLLSFSVMSDSGASADPRIAIDRTAAALAKLD